MISFNYVHDGDVRIYSGRKKHIIHGIWNDLEIYINVVKLLLEPNNNYKTEFSNWTHLNKKNAFSKFKVGVVLLL